MTAAVASEPMARKQAPPPPPEPESEDRATVVNLKGSVAEREHIKAVSRKIGVPVSEMFRRGVAMWLKSRGESPPDDWEGI